MNSIIKKTEKQTEKTALVLSGGGSRGAYQVGAWRAIKELGINIDMVVGVSVGALNGGMVAQGDQHLAEELWRHVEADNVFKVEAGAHPTDFAVEALKQGGVSSAPLQKLANKYLPDDEVRKSPIDFGLMTIEIPAYKPHYLWKDEIPDGKIPDYVVASASIFPGVKPKVIDGVSYIDGGSINVMPIHMAVEHGATKVIAIYLKAVGRFDAKTELSACNDITLIEPNFDLGSFLVFDTENSSRLIRLGYLDAMKAFHVYDGKSYAFIKGEFDKKLVREADSTAKIFDMDPLILYGKESFLKALSVAVDNALEELSDSIHESRKIIKQGFKIESAAKDLRTIKEILASANLKSSTLLIAEDLKVHGEKSIFHQPYASRILGDIVTAAKFINHHL